MFKCFLVNKKIKKLQNPIEHMIATSLEGPIKIRKMELDKKQISFVVNINKQVKQHQISVESLNHI